LVKLNTFSATKTSFMNMYQTLRKKLTSKTSLLVAAAAIVVLSSATVLNAPPNFSGEWKLNESKSEMGQFGRAAKKIKVESLDAQGISYERTSTNQAGEDVVRKEKLTFDGKEVESTGGFGNAKTKSKATISDDAMTIDAVSVFERDGQTTEIKRKETWKLSDGGNVLTIEGSTSFGDNSNTTKLVYDKVK
jgi:hypothetical protein